MTIGFIIIAAKTKDGGIGIHGKLPWKNSMDMKYFKNITTQRINEKKINAVIMGRKTFQSLNFKPLPDRLNICITSCNSNTAFPFFMGMDNSFYPLKSNKSMDFRISCLYHNKQTLHQIMFFNSLEDSLNYLYKSHIVENIFVIGGSMLYQEAICHKDCNEILINEIDCETECDVFFPEINNDKFVLTDSNCIGEGIINKRYIKRLTRSMTF